MINLYNKKSFFMNNTSVIICYIIISWFLIFSTGCDRSVVFEKNKEIPEMRWHFEDKVVFEAEINDTINLHNIHVNVRNSVEYKYMNFYMFLDTKFPDGRIVRDTLECLLADSRGEWTGRGVGNIRSNSFLMRENVWFPLKGKYTFSFEQAMREEVLEGISDIGIRIERK